MPLSPIRRLLRKLRSQSTLADAKFDFVDAISDITSPTANAVVTRMTAVRNLQELWLFRADIFNLVSRQHNQAEASRRLAALTRHAPTAGERSQAPLGSTDAPR